MASRASLQALSLALASLFCASVSASFWGFVCGYVLALALLQLPGATRAALGFGTTNVAIGALLIASASAAVLWRGRADFAELEGLHGLGTRLGDHERLQALPSIAPPLVAADRPQTFFVHASGAHELSVQLGPAAKAISAVDLGSGLFRVDYEPRRDGLPSPANGMLQATLRVDGAVSTRTLISSTPLTHPRGLRRSPNGQLAAAVSEETDELLIVASGEPALRWPVGDGPVACAFVDDAHVVVAYRDELHADVIDVGSGKPSAALACDWRQRAVAVSPDQRVIAIGVASAEPAIWLFDATRGSVLERVPLPSAPDALEFGVDAETLVVTLRHGARVLRVRKVAAGYVPDATLALGRPAITLARASDGSRMWLATTDYRPDAKPQLGNHFVQDQLLELDVASMQIRARRFTAQRSERQSKPGDVDRGLSPLGISPTAAGMLVTYAGSDEVWRLAAPSAEPEITDLADTDLHAPQSAVELADGTLLVTSPLEGAIGVFPRGVRIPTLLRFAPSSAVLRTQNRTLLERRVGERGFYEATRSGIACQSCHMRNESDEAGYNLGEHRLIPTLDVRGLAGTAPYLRDGSYATIADLDQVAETLYRGYLRSQGARGEALQSYLETLPRPSTTLAIKLRDLTAERRGVQVFVRAGCVGCHEFPAFTNLGELPMRVLFPDEAATLQPGEMLDVPSLLSIGESAPYLNDGRAPNLDALLTRENQRNLHGATRELDAGERADLIAFLRSL